MEDVAIYNIKKIFSLKDGEEIVSPSTGHAYCRMVDKAAVDHPMYKTAKKYSPYKNGCSEKIAFDTDHHMHILTKARQVILAWLFMLLPAAGVAMHFLTMGQCAGIRKGTRGNVEINTKYI